MEDMNDSLNDLVLRTSPTPDVIRAIADATGFPYDELVAEFEEAIDEDERELLEQTGIAASIRAITEPQPDDEVPHWGTSHE